ncbi:alpha/beta hydrolase [Streptomyces candidus]|uniref:Pimeloyl-ACP methyl ester carboxylesterase n=1 Tax=Streptomyces candidus TaxID=67283 RepID=A0A7X0HGX1_9ACTN|nr:alpha/beta hydrolase [Streptomyces candidus]MBB6437424.1 pimeloyl-ACP methyl ester carboxylesterase [Streptomyces candidus]
MTRRGAVRARANAWVAAVVLTAVAATGCSTDGGPPRPGATDDGRPASERPTASDPKGSASSESALPAAVRNQKLSWKACAAPVKARGAEAVAPGGEWQCATAQVPLDYRNPAGETLGIALIRTRASGGDAKRIGSLLFNFGGPGGSGVATLPAMGEHFGTLRGRYDLVGFDPRGVADSSEVVCRDDRATEASLALDSTPDTPAEEKAYFADAKAFGAGCAERSGKILPHVGTTGAARDLDVLRQVLGDEQLHYLGFSYGTELGGVYAHLFPKRVGRLVLDAVIDPSAGLVGHSRNQALGFQRALDNYFRSGGTTPRAGTARVVRLLERLDAAPLPAGPGRRLTQSLALTGIIAPLYSRSSWPALTEALSAAERGDGTPLLRLADSYNDRDGQGHYSTAHHSQRAISCADTKGRVSADEVRARHLADFRKVSPVFGPYLAWDLAGWCASWPVPGAHETPEVSAPGAAPVLVVGGTGDPATPFEGSLRMAEELGPQVGVHVTYKGEGHGAYPSGNACVRQVVDAYLLDGKIPAAGTVCS